MERCILACLDKEGLARFAHVYRRSEREVLVRYVTGGFEIVNADELCIEEGDVDYFTNLNKLTSEELKAEIEKLREDRKVSSSRRKQASKEKKVEDIWRLLEQSEDPKHRRLVELYHRIMDGQVLTGKEEAELKKGMEEFGK